MLIIKRNINLDSPAQQSFRLGPGIDPSGVVFSKVSTCSTSARIDLLLQGLDGMC
jgi:hypothetical protein